MADEPEAVTTVSAAQAMTLLLLEQPTSSGWSARAHSSRSRRANTGWSSLCRVSSGMSASRMARRWCRRRRWASISIARPPMSASWSSKA